MNDQQQRTLGVILLVIGLMGIAASVLGIALGGDDPADDGVAAPTESAEPAPAATEAPAATATPVPEPSPTEEPPTPTAIPPTPEPTEPPEATPRPEPTATPVPETLTTFVEQFNAANTAGDTSFAFERLHPVVIEIFGAELCQTWLDNRFHSTTIAIVGEPTELTTASFGLPDGSTSEATDYFTVAAELTFQGSVSATDASFAYVDGAIHWFTNCEVS